MDFNSLQEKLKAAGQEHLLQFWEDLSEEERNNLANNISAVDLDAVNSYFQ